MNACIYTWERWIYEIRVDRTTFSHPSSSDNRWCYISSACDHKEDLMIFPVLLYLKASLKSDFVRRRESFYMIFDCYR